MVPMGTYIPFEIHPQLHGCSGLVKCKLTFKLFLLMEMF